MENALLNLSALLAMVPAAVQALRRPPARDGLFWAALGIAVTAAVVRVAVQLSGPWETGLAPALWLTIAVTLAFYVLVAALSPEAWRLTPLVATYMLVLGILATIWQEAPGLPLVADADEVGWIGVHITFSVATYALVTLAAVAALAAFVQESALKRRRPTALSRSLPSVADCESLVLRLLMLGEGVLALGLATGTALLYRETGRLIVFDHKTVLTIAAFVVLGALLLAHFQRGTRGRRAARFVLLGYLLLTLGYPGVKFVTDVLMA